MATDVYCKIGIKWPMINDIRNSMLECVRLCDSMWCSGFRISRMYISIRIDYLDCVLQTQLFYSNFVIVVSRSACIVYTERSSVHRAKMPTLSPCDVKIKFVVYLRWMRLRLSIREKKCVYHSSVVNTLELFIVYSVILLLFSSFYCSMKEFQWRFVTNNTHKFPREKSVWF